MVDSYEYKLKFGYKFLYMSKKLFFSHQFITLSDSKTGLCKLGLSEYALKYFARFNKITYDDYPKTKYGINYSVLISLLLKQTFDKF